MSDLIVNQVLRIYYENSIIPKLEAKIRKLEMLNKNAFDTITEMDMSYYESKIVCYKCMKLYDYEHVYECCGCYENICLDCTSKFTRRICKSCVFVVHLKCDNEEFNCKKCDGCLFCCKCNKSVALN